MRIFILLNCLFIINLNAQIDTIRWYKGQLHCHSNKSGDGEIDPDKVATKYIDAGYDFISLTDHNKVTDISEFNSSTFLTILGDEITKNSRIKYHVNVYDIKKPPAAVSSLQGCIDNGIKAGAVLIQINHPKSSGQTTKDILNLKGFHLLEVINAKYPDTSPSDMKTWDVLLSKGKRVFGTGNDDFHTTNNNQFNVNWVMVNSTHLTKNSIINSINSGDFYFCHKNCSIEKIHQYDRSLAVYTKEGESITFIGTDGKVLKKVDTSFAIYTIGDDEQYVRAVIKEKNDAYSYTQAYYPEIFYKYSGKIISPTNNSIFPFGNNIIFKLDAFNNIDSIEKIELYANKINIGQIEKTKLEYTWINPPIGIFQTMVKFTTFTGVYYWSNPVNITIDNSTFMQNKNLFRIENNISISFHPFNREISIKTIDHSFNFSIFNLLGKKINKEIIIPKDSTKRIGTNNLPVGMYIMKVSKNNHYILSKKILIQ